MKVEVTRTLKNIVQLRYEDGVLKVVANRFLSDKRLKQIIEENAEWIRARKQETNKSKDSVVASKARAVSAPLKKSTLKAPRNQDDIDIKDVFAGRKTLVLGDTVRVLATSSTRTVLDENTLYIPEKYYQSRETRVKAIKTYLRKMAMLYVSTEISNFGSRISLCPAKIEFREIPDAWLKCSQAAQRILTIDYRVVQLPQNLRQYVIAHAFAHFFHPIHDEKFWKCVSSVLPLYEDYSRQLEKYRYLKDV
ncbi:MAG: DUF45 domain-containing protein [Clostridiales bacterium]|nr:DUF45 domain-containing protein [Clostridiales bacterium]